MMLALDMLAQATQPVGLDVGVRVMVVAVPLVCTVALFTFLAIASWAVQRRREREAYYRHEVELKLAERGELSAEALDRMRFEDDLGRWRRRTESLKLAGMVTLAIGVGMIAAMQMINDPQPRLVGMIPLLIGSALLIYAYLLNPRPPSLRA